MKRRYWKMLAVIVAVVSSAILVQLAAPLVYAHFARSRAIRLLSAAQTAEDREQAVGGLGVALSLPAGEWIAIHYTDSHGLWYSVSVARCSDGVWLESTHHFCGLFSGYRGIKSFRALMLDVADTPQERQRVENENWFEGDDVQKLLSIEGAATLDDARATLIAMGFKPMRAP